MTRGQLITRVGEALALAYDISGYEQTFLQDLANEAVVDVLLETHVYIEIGNMALTSGTAEYRLSPDILAIDDGSGSTPAGIGHYQVITLDEMISRQSVNPVADTYRKFIAIQGDLLIVSPTPGANETLKFYYVPRPTAMSSDAHDPSSATYGGIPSQHHAALEYYMLWHAAEYDDKSAPLSAKDYNTAFQSELKTIRYRMRRMRDRRLTRPRVGYPGSRFANAPSNSQYPRR